MIALGLGHVAGFVMALLVIVGVTLRSSRTVRSAEGFSLHGRQSGIGLIAGSIAGTCIGGSATVGTAQAAFAHGVAAWWFTLGTGVGLLVLAVCYARPLRRTRLETLPQFLGLHFGRPAGTLTSTASSLGILFSSVASMISGVALFQLLFHMRPMPAALVIVALVVASVFVGGLKGTGVAGLFKIAVVAVTLAAAGVAAAMALAGLPDISMTFPASTWLNPFDGGAGAQLGNFASLIVGVVCTQSYIQPLYAATDAKTAARGALLAGLITIPIGLPSIAIGMAMRAAHPEIPPIMALPMFFVLYLPSWLGGVALAGLVFSVVGSVAGLSLGVGTMIAADIGRGALGMRDDRRILWLNRMVVVVAAGFAAAVALAASGSLVLQWNYLSMALRGCGVFLPLTLAIFRPGRLTPGWAVASIILATTAAFADWLFLGSPVNPLFAGIVVSALVVGAGLALGEQHGTDAPVDMMGMDSSGRG